jgi:hypothetical protein
MFGLGGKKITVDKNAINEKRFMELFKKNGESVTHVTVTVTTERKDDLHNSTTIIEHPAIMYRVAPDKGSWKMEKMEGDSSPVYNNAIIFGHMLITLATLNAEGKELKERSWLK